MHNEPGDPYWETVHDFVGRQLVERGLVSPADTELYLVTDDCQAAADEVIGFYRNYDSIRFVGRVTVMRLKQAPTDAQFAELNERFGHLCTNGRIDRATPFEPERKSSPELPCSRCTAFSTARRACVSRLSSGGRPRPSAAASRS